MEDKPHKQYRVITFNKDGTPDQKEDTKLNPTITDMDREQMNKKAKFTKMWYEEIESKKSETTKQKRKSEPKK